MTLLFDRSQKEHSGERDSFRNPLGGNSYNLLLDYYGETAEGHPCGLIVTVKI